MDSVPGQTFLNYAYSWGAAIVILGTLFKLTYLPYANIMLFIGMGTEVFVFFISAFDRPFDKTADGRELPTHLDDEEKSDDIAGGISTVTEGLVGEAVSNVKGNAPAGGQSVVIVQGGSSVPSGNISFGSSSNSGNDTPAEKAPAVAVVAQPSAPEGVTMPQPATVVQPAVSGALSPELAEATERYVSELNRLSEILERVSEQSVRLTRDSEEMENLNRTLTGICKVYEMQLKSASQQIGTIDQINDQTKKMAEQIEQLNSIYARMISAMTVNMNAAAPGLGQ